MENFDPVTGAPLTEQAVQMRAAAQAPQTPCPQRRLGTKREMTFAPFLLLFSILFADCLFHGLNAGTAVCAIALFALGTAYLVKFRQRVSCYGVFCMLAFVACAVSFAFSDDSASKLITLLLLFVLGVVTLLELLPLRRYETGTFGALADGFHLLFAMSFGRIGQSLYGLFHTQNSDGSPKKRILGSVLLGILCALPFLLIIVPLLVSSDAAFEGMLGKLSAEWTGELLAAVLLGCMAFVLLFSLLFAASAEKRARVQKEEGRGLAATPVCAFLGAISVLYVLYLVSQLAYFFNAFGGILPENFTVAQYARRGFFEMTAVCVLNLIIVTLALVVSKKQEGKTSRAVRALSLFLCGFSVILVATALSKMCLYIQRFGMTRLRILTSVFMVFLTVVFIAVALRLFLRKLPYLKVAVIAAAVLLLGVSFANVDRIVAAYNVGAYQNGMLKTIDMQTLSELSDAAVPYLLELSDDEVPAVRTAARRQLSNRLYDAFDESGMFMNGDYIPKQTGYDIREFNLVSYRARQLLLERKDDYFDLTYIRE